MAKVVVNEAFTSLGDQISEEGNCQGATARVGVIPCNKTEETFESELRKLLNKHGVDNDCGMPDFILAEQICSNLRAQVEALRAVREWKGLPI